MRDACEYQHICKSSAGWILLPCQHFWTWFLLNAVGSVWKIKANCCWEINSRGKSLLSPLPSRWSFFWAELPEEHCRYYSVVLCLCPFQEMPERAIPLTQESLQTLKFCLLHQITVSVWITAVCILVKLKGIYFTWRCTEQKRGRVDLTHFVPHDLWQNFWIFRGYQEIQSFPILYSQAEKYYYENAIIRLN